MPVQILTITARQWRDLVNPVLPFAGTDYMLPAINTVQVRTEGKWLIATTTDRFRVAMKRIEKHTTDDDPATEWPEFSALIPLRAVKSILATAKPMRGNNPEMTLTVEDGRLTVEAGGLFDLFDAARFTHRLEDSEFPGVVQIFRDAFATEVSDRSSSVHVNPDFLADFKACGSSTLRILNGAPGKPILLTDDAGFLGVLMPRRGTDVVYEDWSDVLDEKPAADAKPTKKRASKRGAAA